MILRTAIVRAAIILYLLALGAGMANARSFEVNIMTGAPTGTYVQIGNDIAALAAQAGRSNVNVIESAGSMENIVAVKNRSHTQFGIVQSDVLDFIRTFKSEDPVMRSILRNTRYVFPLYKEEVQVVTTKSTGISTLVDLDGRTVGVGALDSGSNLTSTFLLEVANVHPSRKVFVNAGDALQLLLAGRIDAFFYVSGAPTRLLRDVDPNAGLKLVSVPGEIAGDYYGITTIRAETYPWMSGDVETAAVRAVLMTYEYNPNRNAYFRESCNAVSEITYLINQNLEGLQLNGHPKWKEVDLSAVPSGWEQSECVQRGLSETYQPPVRGGGGNSIDTTQDCSTIQNPVTRRLCLMRG